VYIKTGDSVLIKEWSLCVGNYSIRVMHQFQRKQDARASRSDAIHGVTAPTPNRSASIYSLISKAFTTTTTTTHTHTPLFYPYCSFVARSIVTPKRSSLKKYEVGLQNQALPPPILFGLNQINLKRTYTSRVV